MRCLPDCSTPKSLIVAYKATAYLKPCVGIKNAHHGKVSK